MPRPFAVIAMMSIALLAPVQATALSCAALPDPVQVLNAARQVPDHVVVGYGTFSERSGLLELVADVVNSETRGFRFNGVMLDEGAVIPADPTTSVISRGCDHQIWCSGPGHPESDVNYLVAFDRDLATGQLSMFSDLCASSVMLRLVNPELEEIAVCLADGNCTQANFGY